MIPNFEQIWGGLWQTPLASWVTKCKRPSLVLSVLYCISSRNVSTTHKTVISKECKRKLRPPRIGPMQAKYLQLWVNVQVIMAALCHQALPILLRFGWDHEKRKTDLKLWNLLLPILKWSPIPLFFLVDAVQRKFFSTWVVIFWSELRPVANSRLLSRRFKSALLASPQVWLCVHEHLRLLRYKFMCNNFDKYIERVLTNPLWWHQPQCVYRST